MNQTVILLLIAVTFVMALIALFRARDIPPGRCPHCRAPLPNPSAPRCPACGEPT